MTPTIQKFSIYFFIAFFVGLFLVISIAQAKDLDDAEICRAAIAAIMGQKLEGVHFDKEVKQVKYISFAQTPKHSINKFKCSVGESGKIHWASEYGAWRDGELESLVRYEIKDTKLIILEEYNSGAIFKKLYDLNKGKLEENK